MTTALIDADVVVYRSACAVEKTHYTYLPLDEMFEGKKKAKDWYAAMIGGTPDFEDYDTWQVVDNLEPWPNCKLLLDNCITHIMEKTEADNKLCFLTPKETFRHTVAVTQPYKAGRPPPPFYRKQATEYMIKRYSAQVGNKVEADDLLGMNQTTDTVICSNDKDLHMIPGKHYNFVKDEHCEIDLLAADDWFFIQLIMGDRTDNIKGLSGTKQAPGIGLVGARNLVTDFAGDHAGLVEEIEHLYKDKYGDEVGKTVMIEHAQLVYILRRGDTPGHEQWRKLLLLNE